ncbi:MAG: family 2A encapsulin nanocompartment cargo protein cysteine desulfurase [Betaproteobacteria bacterium]
MTIPTPTSKGIEGLSGNAPPPGLPDEATLGRMASEFFRRLPGGAAPSLELLPASSGGFPAPRPEFDLPSASSGSAPLPATQDPAPPVIGRPTEFGVPEAYAAALPTATSYPSSSQVLENAPISPPGSPYYFIGEASSHPAGNSTPVPTEDRVSAKSYGLPGEDELKALLGGITTSRDPLEASRAPDSAGNFYFIDTAHVPLSSDNTRAPFDVNAVRRDFPILSERVNGRPLVWFDNAATTQKPQSVIDRLSYFYAHENSNIHRAAHELAARATDAYEAARNKVQRFIGAGSPDEIIFVRGATEAINLVAKTWGVQNIGEGDEIIVSLLEHHANIVPWQQLVAQTGAKLRVIPVDDSGQIKLDEYQRLLNGRTKLVAITQVSNALGTVTPVKSIIDAAHAAGAKVLVDGAQSVSHLRVNVQALDADFFVFSGHKIFGPTGIGVVYGKKALLESMPPWQGGGNMIADVTFERTLYQPAPNKFEAGTGNIADAVGLGAALDYVDRIGLENIARYEHGLLTYTMQGLGAIPGVRLIGTATEKASVASFVLDGYQPEEVGKALNQEGIAVRSGHHCAQPILRRFGLEATVRPSLAFYNTCEEIDRMLSVVRRLAQRKGGAT